MTKFEDSTLERARQLGYDTVQLKYSGEPVNLFISASAVKVYGASSIRDLIKTIPAPAGIMAALAGTRRPSDTIVVHDCISTEFEGEYYRLDEATYRDRYAIARAVLKELNLPNITLVQNYHINAAEQLWQEVKREGARGLVFRRSTDKPDGKVLLQRYYPELVQHF